MIFRLLKTPGRSKRALQGKVSFRKACFLTFLHHSHTFATFLVEIRQGLKFPPKTLEGLVGVLSKPPFCTNPNIHPSEKATLAQDPCIILHFLTGSQVFSIVTAVISSYLLFFARSHSSLNPNPNIHPGEKATLAQNPCIILHFLTGSHVFCNVTDSLESRDADLAPREPNVIKNSKK